MRWHETAYPLGIGSFLPLLIFDDLFLSLLPGRQWFCLQIGWLLLQPGATVSCLQLAVAQLHCFNLAQVSLNTNKDSCTMSDIHWQKGSSEMLDMETQGTATKRLMRSSRLHLIWWCLMQSLQLLYMLQRITVSKTCQSRLLNYVVVT